MNNRSRMSGVNQLPSIDKIFKEDDDDFTPTVGSNLAAIFGIHQKSQDNARGSPPKHVSGKQSVGNQSQAQASSSPKNDIIHTEAVHAFKLQNGQYMPIGKVGIALTGSVTTKQYNIILYRGTQNYISVLPITPDFGYTVQANNYASYAKGDLSILFESGESSSQFAREICLCKYFSRPVRGTGIIMYQDLNSVSKDALAKEGDGISLKYTTSLDMSQPLKIDNNLKQTMTLEISKDDNWERSLVGTSMGLRRLIIVPSNKQIGLGPGFPKDRDIIMEIEVVSLFTREELSPPIAKPPEISQKATIISRMAKMGQSILPKLPPSTTTDSDDTEEEVVHKTTRHKRAESSDSSSIKKNSHSNLPSDAQMQKKVSNRGELISSTLPIAQRSVISTPAYAPQWAPNQIQQQYVSIDGRLLPLQQQAIAQPIPASMDPTLNVFLSETRTQNTELRMGLSKISDNVQKLLDKFHVLELQQASTPAADKSLEATLKALMDMNRSSQEVGSRDCDTKSTLTTEKVSVDQNLVEANNQLSLRLNALEKKLESANETLATKSASIEELNHQSDSLKQINSTLENRIEELEKELSESQIRFTESYKKLEQSIEKDNKFREENTLLENRVAELTSKCKEMEGTIWKSETSDWVDKSKELKEIMAEVFQELCDSFPEGDYPSDYIKTIIQRTIRSITLRIVSEEKEKKKEKLKKITNESGASILKTEQTNEAFKENNKQNSESTDNNEVCEELAASSMPDDIVDPPKIQTDSVSGSEKKPPPVPKFDLESGYDPPI